MWPLLGIMQHDALPERRPGQVGRLRESAALLDNLSFVSRGRTECGQVTDLTPFARSP